MPQVVADKKEAKTKLLALQELVNSSGWALFVQHCEYEHGMALMKMERCADPTTLAKLVGANLALESMPRWPATELAELVEFLKD